jgi:PAS domain-containing protein
MELRKLQSDFEQKVAERTRELTRSEARYCALLENLLDMVFLTDADGDVTHVNVNFMCII